MSALQRWFRLLSIAALALSASPIGYAAPGVHAPAEGSFVVNTLDDSNSIDNVLSLSEAILIANGDIFGPFSDAEKTQLGGCTFSGSAGSWTITGGCGGAITDTVTFAVTGTINLSFALPDITDSAPLEISGPPSGDLTVNGSGLGAGVTLLTVTSHDNRLTRLNFANSHGVGVRVTGSRNTFDGDTFYGHADHALVLDGGGYNTVHLSTFGVAPPSTHAPFGGCVIANGGSHILVHNGSVQNAIITNQLLCATGDGLWLRDAATANNTIGGNTITDNTGAGVHVSHGSHDNIITDNVIGSNTQSGVLIAGANANTVQLNSIGLLSSGEVLTNAVSGVTLQVGASLNKILTNTIAHSGVYGVWLADTNTRFNAVRANTIVSNTVDGIRLENGPEFNTIGSPIGGPQAQGNIVSGNGDNGITLVDETTAYNWVLGNNVGLNADQTAAQPNNGAGIVLDGAASNIIGITGSDGNVVSGNLNNGLALIGLARDNSVQGNTIGVNALNTRLFPNGWNGVAVMLGAHHNTIGGGTGNNSNFISHSAQFGVFISGSGTTSNTVSNNTIYNSGYDGVSIQSGASANTIGGSGGDDRNYIAGGAGSGISVQNASHNRILRNDVWNNTRYGLVLENSGTTSTYVEGTALFENGADGLIERNTAGFNIWTALSTFNNGGLGIDKQAPGDPASRPHPPTAKITSSSSAGGLTTVNGTGLTGTLVELYGVAPDPSGYGEGKTYLGQVLVSGGVWSLSFSSSAANCFTVLESDLLASSEFGPSTCRVFLPAVVK